MKKTFILICIFVIVLLSVVIIYYQNNKEYIDFINNNGKVEHKIFNSPSKSNKITILLHIDGADIDYKSYIYILDGAYVKKEIPAINKCIKFPNGTGVYVEWKSDTVCNVTCDQEPSINNLRTEKFRINVIYDEARIRSLGKRVIRYKIK